MKTTLWDPRGPFLVVFPATTVIGALGATALGSVTATLFGAVAGLGWGLLLGFIAMRLARRESRRPAHCPVQAEQAIRQRPCDRNITDPARPPSPPAKRRSTCRARCFRHLGTFLNVLKPPVRRYSIRRVYARPLLASHPRTAEDCPLSHLCPLGFFTGRVIQPYGS
jgi:hypothetical protein